MSTRKVWALYRSLYFAKLARKALERRAAIQSYRDRGTVFGRRGRLRRPAAWRRAATHVSSWTRRD